MHPSPARSSSRAIADGGTELRIKVQVDVLGRLGTFGLSVMKTKADRMWEEFGANLVARIDGVEPAAAASAAARMPIASTAPASAPVSRPAPAVETPRVHAAPTAAVAEPAAATAVAPVQADAGAPATAARHHPAPRSVRTFEPESETGWWSRLLGARNGRSAGLVSPGRSIRVEVRQLDKTISVDWPLEGADQCRDWLRELTMAK